MKVAFATIYDARDVRRGSGWPFYLTREIERQGHSVHYLGPLAIKFPLGTRLCRYVSTRILGQRYRSYQDPFIARRLGQAVTKAGRGLFYDVLLTNDYAIAGFTSTDRPIVLYTDAMFPRHYGSSVNPRLDDLSLISVRFCQQITRKGLERASLCAFPAASSACEAVQHYGVGSQQVTVLPFGANLEDPGPEVAEARSITQLQRKSRLDLLFVGKDWHRKGGDTAIKVCEILRARKMNAVLHIVGCRPPIEANPQYVHKYGLLDKTKFEDREKMKDLYEQSDVFLMPSLAEGFGIVYAEAAAYGLPSLAHRTVGVNEAVCDGVSGILLPLGSPASAFADVIESWYADPQQYGQLVRGARQYYMDHCNWARTVKDLMVMVQERLPV